MDLLKDQKLALRFKNNQVLPKEQFLHLLLFFLIHFFIAYAFWSSTTLSSGKTVFYITYLYITTDIGVFVCYQTNKLGDDKEFIERYICLGNVICFQICLILAFVVFFSKYLGFFHFGKALFGVPAISFYFYWRLNSVFKIASSYKKDSNQISCAKGLFRLSFNDRTLALRLKNDQLNTREYFWYLLFFLALNFFISLAIPQLVMNLVPQLDSIKFWDFHVFEILLLITAIGTFICYRINQSGDGKAFIERYICLASVILIQTYLFGFVTIYFTRYIHVPYAHSLNWLSLNLIIIFSYFYFRLGSAIKIVACRRSLSS